MTNSARTSGASARPGLEPEMHRCRASMKCIRRAGAWPAVRRDKARNRRRQERRATTRTPHTGPLAATSSGCRRPPAANRRSVMSRWAVNDQGGTVRFTKRRRARGVDGDRSSQQRQTRCRRRCSPIQEQRARQTGRRAVRAASQSDLASPTNSTSGGDH